MTLRLLVDLYHVQNLRDDGGVSRKLTWRKYERFEVGRQAQFTVWGFRYEQEFVTWSGPALCHRREKLTVEEKAEGENPGVDYFRREKQLAQLGLIEWVPHLVEGDGPDAEIIHPLGLGRTDSLEDLLGAAADEAASAMLTEGTAYLGDRPRLAASSRSPPRRQCPIDRHRSTALSAPHPVDGRMVGRVSDPG